jgi:hypothetical protein
MLPTKLRFIWPSGFREEFFKSANQKQESPVVIAEILLKVALKHQKSKSIKSHLP